MCSLWLRELADARSVGEFPMGRAVWRLAIEFALSTSHFRQDVLYSEKSRARSSVDRASGSGPEGRGFKSLRAHFICLLWSKGFRLIVLPIVLFSAQISFPSVPSISKTTSISAKFAPDFLRRALSWLSKSAGSGNSATVGVEFLLSWQERHTSLSFCSNI